MLTPRLCGFEWQGCIIECQADGLERGNGPSSRGFDDGSNIGVELGAPNGSKAVGDFSEGHAGSQGSLGLVVGGIKSAIGDEEEQVASDFADSLLQLDTFGLDGRHLARSWLSFLTNFL